MTLRRSGKKIFFIFLTLLLSSGAWGYTARENYQFYCAQCHGLKGKADGPNAVKTHPADPRDHTSAYEMGKLTDEEIISVIHEGGSITNKSTLMPPFKKTLTDSEIRALKDYIRRLCRCRGPEGRRPSR